MSPDAHGTSAQGFGGGTGVLRDDMEALKKDLAQLKETLRVLASDAASVAKTQAERVKGRAGEAYGEVKNRVQSAAEQAKAHGQEAVEDLENKIEENPIMSVGIAFGIGLALGALISRR